MDRRSELQKTLSGKTCKIKYTKNYGNCITMREITGTVEQVTPYDVFVVLDNGLNIPSVHIYNIDILD